MRRPAGVAASAIVIALLSLLQLVLALGMVFPAVMLRKNPWRTGTTSHSFWLPALLCGLCVSFVLLTVWGIVAAIGVYRLRGWARSSILILGGGLVVGLFSGLGTLATMAMPLPLTRGMGVVQAQAVLMARAGMAVAAFSFTAMLAIGAWWLVCFNLKSVRAIFAGATAELVESRRPILISIYAVFLFAGSISLASVVYLHSPAHLLWLELRGRPGAAVYICSAALNLFAGIGLWRLKEWARRLALALVAFSLAQYSFIFFHPAPIQDTIITRTKQVIILHAASPDSLHGYMPILRFCLSLVYMAAVAYMLHHYRGRFQPPTPQQAELPAPFV